MRIGTRLRTEEEEVEEAVKKTPLQVSKIRRGAVFLPHILPDNERRAKQHFGIVSLS